MWLREHKHLFKMQVFEPPCISLAVPNKPYTDAVETCFNAMQLKVGLSILLCDKSDSSARHSFVNVKKTTKPSIGLSMTLAKR